jgi:hypothetical protein
VVALACDTALAVIFVAALACRPISLTDPDSSSADDATVPALPIDFSAAAGYQP